jgi:hypothetical protein
MDSVLPVVLMEPLGVSLPPPVNPVRQQLDEVVRGFRGFALAITFVSSEQQLNHLSPLEFSQLSRNRGFATECKLQLEVFLLQPGTNRSQMEGCPGRQKTSAGSGQRQMPCQWHHLP